MPNYSTFNTIISDTLSGLQFYPSESQYIPTSSAAATSAEYELYFPSTLGGTLISNTEANPYIIIPIISSSAISSGVDEQLIIRFFTSSHFASKDIENFEINSGFNVLSISSSLYFTSSTNVTNIKYRDVLVNPGTKGSSNSILIRNLVHDLITGSSYYKNGLISASKQGNFTSSIHYTDVNRGKQNLPFLYTGSLSVAESFSFNTVSQGSGTFNFKENTNRLDPASSSFSINFDNTDKESISFNVGTASLGYAASGRTNDTLLYFSGSGNIGLNTNDPQVGFDVLSEEVQFQPPGARKGLKINNEGNIESFNKDVASATTGSEFILNYSRGVTINALSMVSLGFGPFPAIGGDAAAQSLFDGFGTSVQSKLLQQLEGLGFIVPVQTGDTLGAIRWVAESGSATALDPRSTGETAVLKAVVSDVDASGVQADLIFSVAGKTGAAEQVMLLDAGGNHEMTGSLDISSNLNTTTISLSDDITLANNKKIKNANTGGTYIQVVNDDYWRINANNANVAYFTSTQFIVNPDSIANVDFTVNSDNNVAISMNAGDDTLTFGIPITASADISSSGTITADTLTGKITGGSF
ncbi:hypothetical protein N9Z72_02370 [Akkermansiaceae bacterium]|nr:hypothetical protein [Akkermansiaceae bacterium]